MKVKCNFCKNELERKIESKTNTYFCNKRCKGDWQILQREKLGFTKEWLYSEYIINKKSANQIAKEIKKDAKRVWEWIINYNIPTRPRGTDYGQAFKKGHKICVGRKISDKHKTLLKELRLKDKHVPYLKNGIHWLHHPGAISPNYKGGVTPERQSVYSSLEWIEAVKKVWKRDNAVCQNCGKHHNNKENRGTFHIHHLFSFAEYKHLRCNSDNLVLLCKECHLWVHSNENKENKFLPIKGKLPKWID